MSINHETRERYRKATAAASPGPWLTCWDAPDPDTDDSFRDGAGDKVISAQGLTAYLACSRSNAAFIATAREAMPAYDAALTEALAEIARLRLSTSDLHRRTQQAESWAEAKHVETRRRLATLEQAWKNAKKWTEEMDMRADWAHNPRSLYWPMTSANNAAALAVLVAQRDEALVEVGRLKATLRELTRGRSEQIGTVPCLNCGELGVLLEKDGAQCPVCRGKGRIPEREA